MDFNETPEYKEGRAWAFRNDARLSERYTSDDIIGGSLRNRLFEEAVKLYPSEPGDMENDYRQTLWVMGAFRHIVDTLPMTPQAMVAVFDAAQELGAILGAERRKRECFLELRKKPESWWKKKLGDASPADVVAAASVGWRIRKRKERAERLEPKNRWEVLVDTLGAREMCALGDPRKIDLVKDGHYWYYWVHGPEWGFQMIMRPVMHEGRIEAAPGDIIG
jgi:hypothetical protein